MSQPASATQLALDIKFDLGQKVYPVMGGGNPGLVTAIQISPGQILYFVSYAPGSESQHYDFELSSEKIPEEIPS